MRGPARLALGHAAVGPLLEQFGELLVEDRLVQRDLDALRGSGRSCRGGGRSGGGCGRSFSRGRGRSGGCRCGCGGCRGRRNGGGRCGRGGRADGDRDRGRCHHDRGRLRDVDVTARERLAGPHAIGADDLEAFLVLREPRRVPHVHHDQEQHGGDAEERQQLRHAEHPATRVLDGGGGGVDGRLRGSSGDRGGDEHAGTGEHDEEPAGCLHRADCRNHRAPRQPTALERQDSARSRTGSRPGEVVGRGERDRDVRWDLEARVAGDG